MFVSDKTTKQEALEYAKINGWIIRFLKDELKNDYEVGIAAVKNNGKTVRELGEVLKKNKAVILEASKTFPDAYKFANKSIINEPEIAALRAKK